MKVFRRIKTVIVLIIFTIIVVIAFNFFFLLITNKIKLLYPQLSIRIFIINKLLFQTINENISECVPIILYITINLCRNARRHTLYNIQWSKSGERRPSTFFNKHYPSSFHLLSS